MCWVFGGTPSGVVVPCGAIVPPAVVVPAETVGSCGAAMLTEATVPGRVVVPGGAVAPGRAVVLPSAVWRLCVTGGMPGPATLVKEPCSLAGMGDRAALRRVTN